MTPLHLRPWPDPTGDVGHELRSDYVERYWLPTLGPTAYVVLRHCAARLDASPHGATTTLEAVAELVGVGSGRHQPLVRALRRLERFGFVRAVGPLPALAVRRHLPAVAPKHVRRLPVTRQLELLRAERPAS